MSFCLSDVPFVDRYFAGMWVDPKDPFYIQKGCFIAFLFAAARSGHLYVEVREKGISPFPENIWEIKEPITDLLSEGAHALAKEKLLPVICLNHRFYLQRLFKAEQRCKGEWERLRSATPLHPLDPPRFENEIRKLKEAKELTAEQISAVDLGCCTSLFILTGGPGTGKTFTAARFLNSLWNSLSSISQENFSVALAAPTGKAALNLHTFLNRLFQEHPLQQRLEAKTLHALLNIKGEQTVSEEVKVLPYDLIIVDEVSMIDVELMAHLLSSIKSGAKLFLIGDPHQLPSINGPPILSELLTHHFASVTLTRCLRAESLQLVELAEKIRKGDPLTEDHHHVKRLDISRDLRSILEEHVQHFPLHLKSGKNPTELLESFQRFRILTPIRHGPFGVNQLNQAVFDLLKKQGVFAIPIMIAANDYRLELFNGEIGVLISPEKKHHFQIGKEDIVYFSHGRQLPALLLPRFEWNYAMTIHKSQGSEFDEVLLFLPEEAKPFPPSLIYTAVTRARKKLAFYA